jgi:hypothetical protein
MAEIGPRERRGRWHHALRLALIALFVTWSAISASHGFASAGPIDEIQIAAAHQMDGDGAADHSQLTRVECAAQFHCSSPALVTFGLIVEFAPGVGWTGSPEPAWNALLAAPEGRPPISSIVA